MEDFNNRWTVTAAYAVIFIFAALVLLYNLQQRLYWGDEAETANLAVNITKFGLPKSDDGKNTITINGTDADTSDIVWTWRPWLDLYVTAASFAIIGKTTAAGRLPFALFGLASVVFIAVVARGIYKTHAGAILTALFFVTNQAFILHARQCRYYAIVIAAEILLIYGLFLILRGRRGSGQVCTAIALVLQFYCNYIIVIGGILSLGIFTVIMRRRGKAIARPVVIAVSAFLVAALPWLIYARPWGQLGQLADRDPAVKVFNYIQEINFHMFPLVLIFIPMVGYIYRKIHGAKSTANTSAQTDITHDMNLLLLISIPCQLPAAALSPGIFMRYIIVLAPVFCLLQGYIISKYVKPAIVGCALTAVLCLTNYLSYYPAYFMKGFHEPELPLMTLVRDIVSRHTDAIDDTVAFLKKEGQPDESILVKDPEFPLIFYTGMEIIDYRFHHGVFAERLPDWIFPLSISGVLANSAFTIPDEIAQLYDPITITVHNSTRGGNMPEPDKHESLSQSATVNLVIYHKKSKMIRFLPQRHVGQSGQ
ncbi:MAG: glycosyltransferase family 39 protein [Nitrospirae bacterium]|nr:glycosyltransferase family 39 protein [Nitrospirota bacterium]